MRRLALVLCSLLLLPIARPAAQVRLADTSDREAFRAWFVHLADAQFYRPTPDVIDCAALVRHAAREALRPHTPEWIRTAALPLGRTWPDVRARPPVVDSGLALFRVSSREPARYAEFADAQTLIRLNTRFISRDRAAARPGDLLYFHQASQQAPHHVMVYVGASAFEPGDRDWVVYHTGPTAGAGRQPSSPGEVRKVRLVDLAQHPATRWRPERDNPHFIGVFRLTWL
jgi:uncharacterized protein YfaT (DUF1175 family)